MDKYQEFGHLYDRFIDQIYRFIFLKVQSSQIAEDLTSEVFLKIWTKYLDKGKPIKHPSSLLYRTARNVLTDYYRKHPKKLISLEDYPREISDSFQKIETEIIQEETLKVVFNSLTRLKEEEQDVIIWYYIENLSIAEISQILNKKENTVRVMIHRAIRKLREIIEKENNDKKM